MAMKRQPLLCSCIAAAALCTAANCFSINNCQQEAGVSVASCLSSAGGQACIAHRRLGLFRSDIHSHPTQRRKSISSMMSQPPASTESEMSSNSHVPISTKGGLKNSVAIIADNLPLQRTHERVLFVVYLVIGLLITKGVPDVLLAHSALATVWLTFSLAISFMEAWVKFKAPLLRKYVAVDVGRHVFAAQHAVELGLATAFWMSIMTTTTTASQSCTTSTRLAAAATCSTAITTLSFHYYPAMVSTGMLLLLSFLVGPLLYFRAKYKMVNEAVHELVSAKEEGKIEAISKEIGGKQLPNAKWHVVYVLLDTIKVLGLGIFARNCLQLKCS